METISIDDIICVLIEKIYHSIIFIFFAAENHVNFSEFSDIRSDNSGITDLNNVALSIQPTESDDLAQ